MYHSLKTDKGLTVDIEFQGDKLKEECFNGYDGIYIEISQVTRFGESTNLSTSYIGRIDMTREMLIKVEENSQFLDKGTQAESC